MTCPSSSQLVSGRIKLQNSTPDSVFRAYNLTIWLSFLPGPFPSATGVWVLGRQVGSVQESSGVNITERNGDQLRQDAGLGLLRPAEGAAVVEVKCGRGKLEVPIPGKQKSVPQGSPCPLPLAVSMGQLPQRRVPFPGEGEGQS